MDWNQAESSNNLAAGQSGPRRTTTTGGGQAGGGGKYGREPKEAFGAGSAGTFAYFHDEDEASFSLVDGSKSGAAKRGGGGGGGGSLTNLGRTGQFTRGRGAAGGRGARGGARGDYASRGARGGARGGANAGGRFGWKDWNKEARTRVSSVTISNEWAILEEIEFSRLAKLRLEVDTVEPETLYVVITILIVLLKLTLA